jgi:hypothetical protein
MISAVERRMKFPGFEALWTTPSDNSAAAAISVNTYPTRPQLGNSRGGLVTEHRPTRRHRPLRLTRGLRPSAPTRVAETRLPMRRPRRHLRPHRRLPRHRAESGRIAFIFAIPAFTELVLPRFHTPGRSRQTPSKKRPFIRAPRAATSRAFVRAPEAPSGHGRHPTAGLRRGPRKRSLPDCGPRRGRARAST